MIKSIFYKILKNPENRAKLDSLKGWKDENREFEVYQLFCENGYSKDFDSFEKELNEFLNSAEIQDLVSAENCELSGEKLANVSGGAGVSRRALVGGVATLMAALSLSASASAVNTANVGYSESSSSLSTLSSFDFAVDAGNNEKPKTMAEEIAEKAKPGALKKLPNKDEEHKKFVKIGLKLRKAIKNKRNNVNMNNNENQNSTNRSAQNVDNVAANARAKTMAEEIEEKKLKLDKQRAEKRNNVNEKRVENEKR